MGISVLHVRTQGICMDGVRSRAGGRWAGVRGRGRGREDLARRRSGGAIGACVWGCVGVRGRGEVGMDGAYRSGCGVC